MCVCVTECLVIVKRNCLEKFICSHFYTLNVSLRVKISLEYFQLLLLLLLVNSFGGVRCLVVVVVVGLHIQQANLFLLKKHTETFIYFHTTNDVKHEGYMVLNKCNK